MATSALLSQQTLTVVDSLAGLESIESEWRELWESDPQATPFQTPDWLIPWTRALWGGGKLRVLTLREHERLVAVAPFFLWGYGGGPGSIRLSWLGSGISDYLGMTCAPGMEHEAAERVAEWIAGTKADWDTCDLQELRPASAFAGAAERRGGEVQECSVCPVLRLRKSMQDQLAAADSKFRRDLRTAEKRLQAAGKVEFVHADQDNREALLDRLFELHTGRWRERGECGMFSTEALRGFHGEITRRFCNAGLLRMLALAVNNEMVAVQYNFGAKGRVYAYQAGFDPAWARSSPGAVLLARSIEEAIAEGAREFDFLRHAESFKYAWGAEDTFTQRVWLESPATPGREGMRAA